MVRWLACLWLIAITSAVADDFARQFPPEKLTPVLVGEQTHYIVNLPSKQPISIGTSWLFASTGKSKLSLRAAVALGHNLTAKGWHVVIVTPHWLLPQTDSVAVANDAAEAEKTWPAAWEQQAADSVGFADAKSQLQRLLPLLASANAESKGFQLFIADGMNAALLLAITEMEDLPLPDGLVVMSPYWPDFAVNQKIPNYSAKYPAPVLDVASTRGNNWSKKIAPEIAVQASVQVKLHYRQIVLPHTSYNHKIHWLSSSIVGWTRSLGW